MTVDGPIKTVLWTGLARDEIAHRLRRTAIDLTVADDLPALESAIAETEVLVMPGHFYRQEVARILRSHAGKLRFIQLLTAGYDGLAIHGIPANVAVASNGEVLSPVVAEHGMALLLALTRNLPQTLHHQLRHAWDKTPMLRMRSLQGMRVLIVGFGSIAREFASRIRPFGVHIVGVNRSGRPHALVDEMFDIGTLDRLLPQADVVLLALPYTPAMHRLFNARRLALCKVGALLVNLARGALVDQTAMTAALQEGRIGGFATDVSDPEPLADDDPLWQAPNVIITPHVAGNEGPQGHMRLADFVGANLDLYVAGKPVRSLIGDFSDAPALSVSL